MHDAFEHSALAKYVFCNETTIHTVHGIFYRIAMDIDVYSVNAPRQASNPSATTQETIIELLHWIQRKIEEISVRESSLEKPTDKNNFLDYLEKIAPKKSLPPLSPIKHIIFVSNQPYALYQQAIIESVFHATGSTITFETIGKNSYANKDQILTIIGSLGSFLWATTPALLASLDIQTTDPENIELCKQLYEKVDSLYKRLPPILRGE